MAEFNGASSPVQYSVEGANGFGNVITLPTTALQDGDIVLLYGPFPERSKFFNAPGQVSYDMGTVDSHATPTFEASIGFTDSGDSALDIVIKTAIDEDEEGENVQVSGQGAWIDIAGKYLAMEVTTSAATAASADLDIGGQYYANIKEGAVTAA